jgi:sugar/nucleoside kinase (ribokinase family)
MDSIPLLRFLIAGQLRRDHIITNSGKTLLDIPGGNLLYSAAGLGVWEKDAGLISRVSQDFPQEWLDQISKAGFDRRGIRVLSEVFDQRSFMVYSDQDARFTDTPISHFASLGIPYPKSLLGYTPPSQQLDSKTQPINRTIRLNDFPPDYLDATAAHLCPLDFLSHTLLPSALRQGHISTITIDPSPGYMNPTFWDELPKIVRGISAFICSEEKICNLFQGRSSDPWEMAECLGDLGCEIIVIKRGARGQYLYCHSNHTRWMVPAYPVRMVDPTGCGDAFCGGFLAGYHKTYDPLTAVLYGNISASLVIEGSGPYFALDSLPGLAPARLDALQGMVRKV